jgi:fumarate reductase flavoprotein subunit
MGGVRTSIEGRARNLAGLYAAGETGCWDLHGFNRLGGNSVAETIVMGMVVGRHVAQDLQWGEVPFPRGRAEQLSKDFAQQVQERIRKLQNGGAEYVYDLYKQMGEILVTKAFVFRNGKQLSECVEELRELQARAARLGLRANGTGATPELATALRLPGMLRLATTIAYGALQRTESRGSHFREDFPKRDDANWLKRTLATWKPQSDLPTLDYEPVECTELPPGERGYGEAQAR